MAHTATVNGRQKRQTLGKFLSDRLLSHTARWYKTSRRRGEWGLEDYEEADQEVHYGSQIGCGGCKRLRDDLRFRSDIRDFQIISGPSFLGWLFVLKFFASALFLLYLRS